MKNVVKVYICPIIHVSSIENCTQGNFPTALRVCHFESSHDISHDRMAFAQCPAFAGFSPKCVLILDFPCVSSMIVRYVPVSYAGDF